LGRATIAVGYHCGTPPFQTVIKALSKSGEMLGDICCQNFASQLS